MSFVDVLCPGLPETKPVKLTNSEERWFKTLNGVLYLPSEHIARGNFLLVDKMIEALEAYKITSDAPEMLWDDNKVIGHEATTEAQCFEFLDIVAQYKILSVDIESRNTGYDGNKLLLIGFGVSDYETYVIRVLSEEVRTRLCNLFARRDITFIWHNGKFDCTRLSYLAGINARIDEDTMLQHYVGINERKGTHSLKDLGEIYLQAPKWDDELEEYKREYCRKNKIKLGDFQYDMIPDNILIPYLYRDCGATFQLNKMFHKIMRPGSIDIYRKLCKASNVYKDIELSGNLVDMPYMYELEDWLDTQIVEAERVLNKAVSAIWDPKQYCIDTGAKTYDTTFNMKSPKQLKWMLEKATGTRLTSTDKNAIAALAEQYPNIEFLKALLELRKYNKYMDTYVQGIQKLVCSDGRVRCTFQLHGTETGRLSCKDPNMQNIPRQKKIKNIFKAPEGYKLVQLDYSQAELRVLAYVSGDEYLRQVYREGRDLHDAMAEKIFGPEFNKEQRVAAKTVNFGIPYGRGPGTIAAQLNMSYTEAAKLIRDWFAAAPMAKKFVDNMRRKPFLKDDNIYTTVFGRIRHYIVTSENRNHIENESVNFPISSIASDLTMLSVCDIHDEIEALGINARIVNSVHDSIIIECIDDQESIQKVIEIGQRVMSNLPKQYLPGLDFPFKADAEVGQSWGDLENADEFIQQQMAGE